ncbi:endonuclease/exonuclease/phosphatase domain containing protein [Plasmodium cynomolgi strain B]|uniref:Endonuclease/exonuclease/phosphatase domain containing protein n=1 Tax=Plasmodium cynomolgi (strain B) TaxID=1120755 RepID=K6UXE8_PLACD|nr:endonuclease/exonuclease/phosphatase domain containing protein [Plasmodium cynomolgi strain B]GAB67150.1 endonuclease/exonuclease/phosphatase domain containing protein [Plasmodium cynomolgi strain B]
MFCAKNSAVLSLWRRTFALNSLKKDEQLVFKSTGMRNGICIGRKNNLDKIAHRGGRKRHISSKCNSGVDEPVGNAFIHTRGVGSSQGDKNTCRKGGLLGSYPLRSGGSPKNYRAIYPNVNESQYTMDDACSKSYSKVNRAKEERSSHSENPKEVLTKQKNVISDEINNTEMIKCRKDIREKKIVYKFKEFSVFSFNILADSLVDYKYENNCSNVMRWINRKEFIFQSIRRKLSDIICLQEIEESYFNELQEKLKLLFFDEIVYDKSAFLKKWHVGLIVALKNKLSKKVEWYDGSVSNDDRDGSNQMVGDHHVSGSPGSDESADDIVIVSNTHLIFDSCKGDVKLYQLCYMTYRLVAMMNKCLDYLRARGKGVKPGRAEKGNKAEETGEKKKREGSPQGRVHPTDSRDFLSPAVIFCGDLNITPNSLLYYYIVNRYINLKKINMKNISGQYLMFKKQFYVCSYEKGSEIKKMFDENILSDLKYDHYNSIVDNMKRESLFSFFKNERILDEGYLTSHCFFHHGNDTYLRNYNSYEYLMSKFKEGKKDCLSYWGHSGRKSSTLSGSEVVSNEHTCDENCAQVSEEKDHGCISFDEMDHEEGNEDNAEQRHPQKEAKIATDQHDDDFILYYPLYFESIYNSVDEHRVEKPCHKYDHIDNLNDEENNLPLSDVPFTVFHGKQKGCVDYIFYSYRTLKVSARGRGLTR